MIGSREKGATVAICFSSDEAFFGFTKGLVLSLLDHFGSIYDLHFIDIGLSMESRDWLRNKGVRIVPFDPSSQIEGFGSLGHAPYLAAMICRPILPEIVPGYEVYVWLDSDTWVQESRAIEEFVSSAAGSRGRIAISSTTDWIYAHTPDKEEEFQNYSFSWYSAILGEAVAQTYMKKSILNSGFFALRSDSFIWKVWEMGVTRFYSRPTQSIFSSHMAEQTWLNYICYAHDCAIQFDSFYNFNCHMGSVERHNGRVRRTGDDIHAIGIVHLTVSGRFGGTYLDKGLLYQNGDYLTEQERERIRGLKHQNAD